MLLLMARGYGRKQVNELHLSGYILRLYLFPAAQTAQAVNQCHSNGHSNLGNLAEINKYPTLPLK